MKQHITRAYNSFDEGAFGTITKKSNEKRLDHEIQYYDKIHNTLHSIHFPRLIRSWYAPWTDSLYNVTLEYYPYRNLGQIMINDDFDKSFWENVYSYLCDILDSFRKEDREGDFTSHAVGMYETKTWKYYQELLKVPNFLKICESENIEINGVFYRNFGNIWEEVKEKINSRLIPFLKSSVIHGDLCFSNILSSETDKLVLRLIDPRGSFGDQGIYGDHHYDWAKLLHSIDGGYEYIIYDEFTLDAELERNRFRYSYSNENKNKIMEVFGDFHEGYKLIQGLIYIGMCSRHYDSFLRQLVMYLNGVRILNEVLDA